MDQHTLRKVQLVQLEIAKEIRRICDENNISYCLTSGSCLGAVRHKGFIPWDDDLDIGMLRSEYIKFCDIVSNKLNSRYCFQNWHLDNCYAMPFGKVRKCGTVYQEGKAIQGGNNGIYVDIIVYDNLPKKHIRWHLIKLYLLERIILMKCKYTPWMNNEKISWGSRLFYLPFQFLSIFFSLDCLKRTYEKIAIIDKDKAGKTCGQVGERIVRSFDRSYMETTVEAAFEDDIFRIPGNYDGYLRATYGDYMQLPPEDQRENRHQIQVLDFGEE